MTWPLDGFIDAISFLASTDIPHFPVRKVKAGANFLDQQHLQHCVWERIGCPCLDKTILNNHEMLLTEMQ